MVRGRVPPTPTCPDLCSATCESAGGATGLQAGTLTAGGRPLVSETPGPAWGHPLDDINRAPGDLVADVAAAEGSYGSGA